MPNTILYLAIALAVAGLVVVVFRKFSVLSVLSEEEISILERRKGFWQKAKGINFKQHWLNFIVILEKILRRIHILFLKIENILSKWIKNLRVRSQIAAQKSREWILQREMKRRKVGNHPAEVSIKIEKRQSTEDLSVKGTSTPMPEDDDSIPLSELKKPIKEEQKWIDLIVENPKNITAYKFLGFLYWKQHNYADAKNSLEMAVKLGSKDKKVREIIEEIEGMGI